MVNQYPVRSDEINGVLHGRCPYCSQAYPVEDFKGIEIRNGVETRITEAIDLPAKCKRCGCPMDLTKAGDFEDAQAEKAAVTSRAMQRPTRSTQIREPAGAKGR